MFDTSHSASAPDVESCDESESDSPPSSSIAVGGKFPNIFDNPENMPFEGADGSVLVESITPRRPRGPAFVTVLPDVAASIIFFEACSLASRSAIINVCSSRRICNLANSRRACPGLKPILTSFSSESMPGQHFPVVRSSNVKQFKPFGVLFGIRSENDYK